MKLIKLIPVFLFFVIFASNISAQDKMMDDKKDDMKMKEKDKMMMNDKDKMIGDKMTPSHMMIDKDKNGVAIKGYDPVAYFTDSRAVIGKQEYSYKWMDAEWRFTSKSHLDMFMKSPEMYAPQYGGYCAYGMTMNEHFSTDPMVWKIVDGKLYLNKNPEVGKEWSKNIEGNIMKSDESWMKETAKK